MEVWQRLLRRVEMTHSEAAGPFFSAKLISWKAGEIKVGYGPNSFELSLARGKLATFEQGCKRHVDQPVTVTIEELSANSDSLSAMDNQVHAREEQARKRRQEAAAHPLTRAVVRELGGEIKNITTEADK